MMWKWVCPSIKTPSWTINPPTIKSGTSAQELKIVPCDKFPPDEHMSFIRLHRKMGLVRENNIESLISHSFCMHCYPFLSGCDGILL
ncbi:hypothetical protein TNCV_3538881 [Trichonephila clavipes]|nr:hypothetical protein TNCV_3538881 [Trichonephila clavipes]